MDLGKETPLDLSKRLEVHNRQESLKGPFKIVHLTMRIDCIPHQNVPLNVCRKNVNQASTIIEHKTSFNIKHEVVSIGCLTAFYVV